MAVFGVPTTVQQYQSQRSGQSAGTYNNDPNSPSNQFLAAVEYGKQQDPYGLNALMNSDQYKGAGNNTQAYDEAYQNAVNASRANITQSLGAALSELSNREGAINAAGAAAPGQIAASYGRANDAIAANTGAVTGIMGQAQVNPDLGPSMAGANAPVLAALAGNQAEAQAGVQPVVSGLGAEISKERAGLQTNAGDKLSALGMQAADHAASAASNEPSWMQKTMIQTQISEQQAKAANDTKSQQAAAKTHQDLIQLQSKAGNAVSASAGKAFANSAVGANYVNQVESGGAGRASKAYAQAMTALGAAWSDPKDTDGSKFKTAMAQLQHQFPKQHVPISIALYRLGVTDKQLHGLGL